MIGLVLFQSGCAVHYFDRASGTEHIWGLGHMKMKVSDSNEGLTAVVHGADILGASIGKADLHTFTTLGWNRLEFIDIRKESTVIHLQYPKNGFVNVRIGSSSPAAIHSENSETTKNSN